MTLSSQIGAFFDLDGTLLSPPSLEWRFIAYLVAHDKLPVRAVARWFDGFAKGFLRSPRAATSGNKRYLAGIRGNLARDWENSTAPGMPRFFPEGLKRLAWHAAQGHRVFFVSGTLEPLASAIARRIPARVIVSATNLESHQGVWTGRVTGEHVSFREKARIVHRLALQYGLHLDESYAYGDRIADLDMLRMVGRPVAVNPRGYFGRIAKRHAKNGTRVGEARWEICKWNDSDPLRSAAHSTEISPEKTR